MSAINAETDGLSGAVASGGAALGPSHFCA